MKSLTILNLSKNKIVAIKKYTFKNLKSVINIDLTNNYSINIYLTRKMKNEEIFNGLENLKIINQIILADIIEEKNKVRFKLKYISN